MPQRKFQFNAPTNPFLQVLYFVVGGIVLIGAILMGAFLLSIALGLAIIAGLVIYVRVWWLKRRFKAAMKHSAQRSSTEQGDVLEVEYTVVEERDEHKERDSDQ